MRNYGILAKQQGKLVTKFRLFIFKVLVLFMERLWSIPISYIFSVPLWWARCLRIKAGSSASQKTIGSYSSLCMLFTNNVSSIKCTRILPAGLIAQLVGALHRYRTDLGFESYSSLNFFRLFFNQLLKLISLTARIIIISYLAMLRNNRLDYFSCKS